MSYHKTLAKMVSASNMSLREIADGCKALGVPLDPSYISKLQSGKQPPASEEITVALAKVCKGDPQALLYEGNMEKAPESFKQVIKTLVDYLRQTTKVLFVSSMPADMAELFQKQLDELPDYEFINQLIKPETLKVPTDPIMKFNDGKNDLSLVTPQFHSLVIQDDSMEPLIPNGSRLHIEAQEEANDGDIVIVKFSDNRYLTRRYNHVANKTLLIPENRFYDPTPLDKKSMRIVGKVKSVSFDI